MKVCPAGTAYANGTYVEQAELDDQSGLPRFLHSGDGDREVRYWEGYWVCGSSSLQSATWAAKLLV